MENRDEKWQSLLKWSGSTFEPDAAPPYGFIASTLARLTSERRAQEEAEKIGWRALLASIAALAVAAVVTLSVMPTDSSSEFEPGTRTLVAVDNVQVL